MHAPRSESSASVCDPLNRDEDGNPLCAQARVLGGGNPDLEPIEIERISVGATARFDPFTFSADWFTAETVDFPTIVSAQTVIDRVAAGNPVPGTRVQRRGGQIQRIDNPTVVQAAEFETSGVALHAGAEWATDWVDLALDVYATRRLDYEYRVLDVETPLRYWRDRAHAVLRASRGDLSASWNVHAIAEYQSKFVPYKAWYGHDLALQWRDALGIGLDLTGGVLNLADRGPSLDSSGIRGPDLTLDAVRGRTFFLDATMRW